MSLFTVNYSNVQESSFEPLPEGNYECIIQSTQEKTTKNGKEAFSVKLVVRNDLTQVPTLAETNGKYANRILFDDHWKRDIDGRYIYHMESLMYVLKAAQIPEGTQINSMDDLHEILRDKPVKIYTKKENNTYNGETTVINTIAPWGYSPSDYSNVQHVFKDSEKTTPEEDGFVKNDNATTISDDDLPF